MEGKPTLSSLSQAITSIEKRVEKHEEALYGNGSEGIKVNIALIMESQKSMSELLMAVRETSELNGRMLREIKASLEGHISSKDVHTLPGLVISFGIKRTMGILSGIFIFLSLWFLVLLNVAPEVNIWDIIAKWLGL